MSKELKLHNRGTIIYVKTELNVSLLETEKEFEEFIAINVKNFDNAGQDLMFVNMYRKPCSLSENNDKLNVLINYVASICSNQKLLIVGDFNYPHINWQDFSAENEVEEKFIEVLQDNFMLQNVDFPTRARGQDNPHVLDLVLTNDDFINDIDMLAPWVRAIIQYWA